MTSLLARQLKPAEGVPRRAAGPRPLHLWSGPLTESSWPPGHRPRQLQSEGLRQAHRPPQRSQRDRAGLSLHIFRGDWLPEG